MASTDTTPKINLRMGADELDLLADMIDYYARTSDEVEDRRLLRQVDMRVHAARDRLASVGQGRCDTVTMDQRCLLREGHPGGHVSSEWGI